MWQLAKNTQDQFYTRAATNGHLEQTFSVPFELPHLPTANLCNRCAWWFQTVAEVSSFGKIEELIP